MNISALLPLIRDMPPYRRLLEALRGAKAENGVKLSVLEAAHPYVIAALHQDLKTCVLVLTARPEQARLLHAQIQAWCPDKRAVLLFPEPDALPYELIPSDPSTIQGRLKVLSSCAPDGTTTPIIVASVYALAQKTLSPGSFHSLCHTIRKGMEANLESLISRWARMGYEIEQAVEVPGTASRRGGILDIYPPHSELPARIELLGDRVESIRLFDPSTQRSMKLVEEVLITPAREVIAPKSGMETSNIVQGLDFSRCQEGARERLEEEIRKVLEGSPSEGSELYSTFFNNSTLLEHLPKGALVILGHVDRIKEATEELHREAQEMRQTRVEAGVLPSGFPSPYLPWPELWERIGRRGKHLVLESWGWAEGGEARPGYTLDFGSPQSYNGQLRLFLEDIQGMLKEGQRVLIVSHQARRLSEILGEIDIIAPPLSELREAPSPGSVSLLEGPLAEGWVANVNGACPITLLTDAEVFGTAKQRRFVRRRPVKRGAFLSELSVGQYVVHVEHGIARFAGVVRLDKDGVEGEYLLLQYAEGDKLYVPTQQIDRVSSYIGQGDRPPALTRLGTQEWNRAKRRVKEAAEEFAKELLALYASREVASGFAFSPDTSWQQEMESSFPYVETPDQLSTIMDVKDDMERPRPMDRLVCGDVGYGKTEVALRAAFKAVQDGKQVAILVPTTVLAQQHLTTFTERLKAFPVRVEVLSRFRSEKEQKEVIGGLRSGAVDICIGTHRLLQKDVAFKDLGLLIVDEEQRFGVTHKERLKHMRGEVDVLILSATPIPRTLHMSLVGIRDMSTVETPPEERWPVRTYVGEYEEGLVRESILRELERDGQVFFVHNRVHNIARIAHRLALLVPEAKIAVGHGQMPEEELERAMLEFYEGRWDVLVCTTIIESGLDLPNVNTLIINEADKLGLAQLYQLRGRVGRSSHRAYAYFLFDKGKVLTETAEKRLRTILAATELGAGFRIAMKDLEIRGAGNLLGPEQSGHISAVGFDLYCSLLAEAVEELRAKESGQVPVRRHGEEPLGMRHQGPSIHLPVSAHIPQDYIPDVPTRLSLYQRMAKITSAQGVEEVALELRDRFGRPPEEMENLLYLVKIKALAEAAGVQSISTEDGQVVLRMRDGTKLDRAYLLRAYGPKLRVGHSQVRLDTKRLGRGWQELLSELLEQMAQHNARVRQGTPNGLTPVQGEM